MTLKAALLVAALAGYAVTSSVAQQPADVAVENSPPPGESVDKPEPTADSAAAEAVAKGGDADNADSGEKNPRSKADAVLAAQSAGYKLVNKDGKQVFCKREYVTGSRLATSMRCLTLEQIERERAATEKALMEMGSRPVNVPDD